MGVGGSAGGNCCAVPTLEKLKNIRIETINPKEFIRMDDRAGLIFSSPVGGSPANFPVHLAHPPQKTKEFPTRGPQKAQNIFCRQTFGPLA
jgi:hypothetical protein